MIRALVFAALVGGATWASHIYDRRFGGDR